MTYPWSAGEVLSASDLNAEFASKLPYSYGTATPSTSVDGFLWYDENDTPPTPKFWDGAAFQALTSGKILQIVRATDSTDRSTTSTSFVDIPGMSITITPQKTTSAILLISSLSVLTASMSGSARIQVADSSDNPISGAEEIYTNTGAVHVQQTLIGYATPATTSATTYKTRFRISTTGTLTVWNSQNTGQMYAIEVSA